MANDILQIVENLKKNYKNLKPGDFDGIMKICRENLECVLVVLDKEHSHSTPKDSTKTGNDDNINTTCQCGVIGRFFARIVRFLYECGRKVQKSAMYRFLLKFKKKTYLWVKFFGRQIRFYRC